MRNISVFVFVMLGLVFCGSAQAEDAVVLNVAEFENVVIQHHGRLKPIDTFARATLIGMYEKQSIGSQSASNWLAQAMLGRDQALTQKTFTIRSPAVVKAIGVAVDKDSRYSLNELKQGMMDHETLILALQSRQEGLLDETETQLVQKYQQVSMYMALIHSLSCFWPDIQINDQKLAEAFKVPAGSAQSYFFFATHQELSRVLLDSSKAVKENPAHDDSAVRALWGKLNDRLQHEYSGGLEIIPPAPGEHDIEKLKWRSPWMVLDEDGLSELELPQMEALNQAVAAYRQNDQSGFDQSIQQFRQLVGYDSKRSLELFYNKADFFYRSLYFYIASFLCLMVFWMAKRRVWYKISVGLLASGAVFHIIGVGLRMFIMERPPVSTLYESVIFASLIAVLFGLAIELWRKDTTALLTATIIGIKLQFIGFSFAAEGDSMGMLEAVLNSVFWLSTHVVTIIIGYGASLVAGIFGHILLARYIWHPLEKEKNQQIFKTARGIALVALFFTTLGTILGGIWADQSWGRFWGWDPKENGAMLIVLWLLIAIHGFISGELKHIGFAMFLALTNICVALAWFGVNLLSVGLHSYGFNNKTAVALGSFCAVEFIIVIVATAVAMYRRRCIRLAAQQTLTS